MHTSFLKFLADPITKEPLRLESAEIRGDIVRSGFLCSKANRYPITSGVPRFVEVNNYSDNFGYQWTRWSRTQFESANAGKPMQGHTLQMWHRITEMMALQPTDVLLDIGCGPGRFIDVVRSKGARIIGIDYSGAADVAAENFKSDADVCVCQADALHLPIAPGTISGAFSIGVLHHTPNPETGINEAYLSLTKGGWFAVAVYGKGGYYDFPPVQMWRKLFLFLWPLFKHVPPLIYTYVTVYGLRGIALRASFLGKAVRLFLPFVSLPDRDWSLLDTFDSVTPAYQSAHESYEVYNWLTHAGFAGVRPTNWGFTSYRGESL